MRLERVPGLPPDAVSREECASEITGGFFARRFETPDGGRYEVIALDREFKRCTAVFRLGEPVQLEFQDLASGRHWREDPLSGDRGAVIAAEERWR